MSSSLIALLSKPVARIDIDVKPILPVSEPVVLSDVKPVIVKEEPVDLVCVKEEEKENPVPVASNNARFVDRLLQKKMKGGKTPTLSSLLSHSPSPPMFSFPKLEPCSPAKSASVSPSFTPALSAILREPPKKVPSLKRTRSFSPDKETKRSKSGHNAISLYPFLKCYVCDAWVCSRNRFIHCEAHLQYRPYHCNQCDYSNRKLIFVQIHCREEHTTASAVLEHDVEIEKKVWDMAERCILNTRNVLMGRGTDLTGIDLKEYATIHSDRNVGRSEKMEEMLKGVDRKKLAREETQCQLCLQYIARTHEARFDHCRSHMPPSFECAMVSCPVRHHSRGFIARHCAEAHSQKLIPKDLIDEEQMKTLIQITTVCFPGESICDAPVATRKSRKKTQCHLCMSMVSEDMTTVHAVSHFPLIPKESAKMLTLVCFPYIN